MSAGPVNLLVFREDSRSVAGPELKAAITQALGHDLLSALLLAGEMECGVADAADESACGWEELTDALAHAVVTESVAGCSALLLERLPVQSELRISTHEGFAYYGLHPLAYADVLENLPEPGARVLVVGIRSIGATLSAVAAAAARRAGRDVSRITVRPEGHPYYRHARFSPHQLDLISQVAASNGSFVVVDEGPGLSGSSFISVAEALVEAGAPCERITLVCAHEPDLDALQTTNGPTRARQFRWVAINRETRRPTMAEAWVGAGEWRKLTRIPEESWPASWTNFERMKFLCDRAAHDRTLFKFAGLGHYGERVTRVEEAVAAAGFGPVPVRVTDGFTAYPWLSARPMRSDDLSPPVLSTLAEYCAFRSGAFPVGVANLDALRQMAGHNLAEMKIDIPLQLRMERPVIVDGRMQPHEWLFTPEGNIFKTDSGSHGDDHFFPGPTDIAWDLAGAIVEWQMNAAQQETFLDVYRLASGDDPKSRIRDFIVSYAVFRLAYCCMAGNALRGTDEQRRLQNAADYYRKMLASHSSLLTASGF